MSEDYLRRLVAAISAMVGFMLGFGALDYIMEPGIIDSGPGVFWILLSSGFLALSWAAK